MCIFLYLELPPPNRQCRVFTNWHVVGRRGKLFEPSCGCYVDRGTQLDGPFDTDAAAEAALRVAAQVDVVP